MAVINQPEKKLANCISVALVDYADLTAEESSAGLHVHIKSRTSTLVQSDRRTTVKLISDLTVSKL